MNNWKSEIRQINERFWHQLATEGVPGVALRDDPDWVVTHPDVLILDAGVLGNCDGVINCGQQRPHMDTGGQPRPEGNTAINTSSLEGVPTCSEGRDSDVRQSETDPQDMLITAPADEFLTLEEVCERLRLTPRTVRRWRKQHGFPETRIGHTLRFNWRMVIRWMEVHSFGISPDEEVARDGKRRGRRPRTDV